MASRFTDTELWNEDWYCEMPGEYQLFVRYVFDKCDNTGVWKPNKFDFETKTKFKVSPDLLFKKMNEGGGGEQRVLLLENGRWFLTGYISFQWFNKKKTFDLVLTNRLHKSLYDNLLFNKVPLKKVRGLKEVLKTSMYMVMDRDKGGVGEKEKFSLSLESRMPAVALEAIERNQFTFTKAKNTDFIHSQWKIFLMERMADPPLKKGQYRQIEDLSTYFINWMRDKFPRKISKPEEKTNYADATKLAEKYR